MIIVGAGALGLLYGARLADAGMEVVLLTRSEEQAKMLREEGIRLTKRDGGHCQVRVQASTIDSYVPDALRQEDWIWLTVKQVHLSDHLLRQLGAMTARGCSVLALQNGIGHLDLLRKVCPKEQLNAAITTEGAMRIDEYSVHHTGSGTITFGSWPKNEEKASKPQKMLLKSLFGAGIEGKLSNEMENVVYRKLLINAVINPLTGIFAVKNGELPSEPSRLRWMKALHEESEHILTLAGMTKDADSWEQLLRICEATAGNQSSMLRDVQAGRITEIDWINGGIVSLAGTMQVSAPMNEAVLTLIKTLQTN
ncbi:ketopantoate reductase family protein [Paenibacillus sp. CF384]|uniref:ketopantoate reductase family protein n=1 Tax=Paenibacillus sp. CF384 TaxID=1884382 RepID=UPI000B8A3CB0|nr:2-dehydropantoate 2-reductase [Paenibacillus sp. CF384]